MSNEKIFYDMETDTAFREDQTEIGNANAPIFIYNSSRDLDIQILATQDEDTNGDFDDFYTGLVGKTITARNVIDNNFNHTATALLSTALSNGVAVATVTIKSLATKFNITRPCGTINIGSQSFNYNAITASGTTYILQCADADFVSSDFTPSTDYASDTALTGVEVALVVDSAVDVTDQDTGLLVATVNTYNRNFQAEANGKEEIESCFSEFSIVEGGVTILRKRFEVICFGAIDDDGETSPAPDGGYYNKTESDSRYFQQALSTAYSQVTTLAGTEKLPIREGSTTKYCTTQAIRDLVEGSTNATLATADSALITLFDKTIFQRAELVISIEDTARDNIIDYVYKVAWNGTDATDDGGDTFIVKGDLITGIAITFLLSTDDIQCQIANTSGGTVAYSYKINDSLILSQ